MKTKSHSIFIQILQTSATLSQFIFIFLPCPAFMWPLEKKKRLGNKPRKKTGWWIHEGNRASGQARENKAVYGVCLLNNAVELCKDENSLPDLNILLCLLLSSKNTLLISIKSLLMCTQNLPGWVHCFEQWLALDMRGRMKIAEGKEKKNKCKQRSMLGMKSL